MDILILFEHAGHSQTIDELCKNIELHQLRISSFNVVTWRLKTKSGINISWVNLLCVLAVIPGLRGFLTKLFRYKALLKLSSNYTIIDIHFFSPIYDKLIEELKNCGKKVKITIWGSDFYRVDIERRELQRIVYHMVDLIQIETHQIADDFLKVYPEYADKIRITRFGNIQFELIDGILQNGTKEALRKEFNLPNDKIILTCGTNGSEGHQHLKILESIEKLSPGIKSRLFLLFPMTYSCKRSYVNQVRQRAHIVELPFLILTEFLSLNDISKLKIVSDIMLTIQTTDALSLSVMEYVYAGKLLIAGEWLPYQALKDMGIFYLTTSTASLSETISESVRNFESMVKRCSGNSEKISKLSSWNQVTNEWVAIYNEIAE